MFISLKELKNLFATSNQRKIDGGSTLTCTEVSVDDTLGGTILADASATRRRVIVQNNEAAQIVAVGPAGLTLSTGHVLAAGTDGAGGVVTLFTKDAVYGIAGAAADVRVLVEAD